MFEICLWRALVEDGREVDDEGVELWSQPSTQPWDQVWFLMAWGSMGAPRGQPLPLMNNVLLGSYFSHLLNYLLLSL